jgi:two-component system response regulator LytT
MNILIIEDEARIAKRLERMALAFFGETAQIRICESFQSGLNAIDQHPVDLLLLDLNLNGENGFDILETMVAGAFQTIIVSAYTDKAITAFTYGVLDFVPKPFDEIRLGQAFARLNKETRPPGHETRFLAVKKNGRITLIEIKNIRYIKGAGIYTELHLNNHQTELHDKSLEALEKLLPGSFERIHKSYIVCWQEVDQLVVEPGGRYSLKLKNNELLPVGRSKYKTIKMRFI